MEALEKVQEPYEQLKNDDTLSVGLIRQNILDLKIQFEKGEMN